MKPSQSAAAPIHLLPPLVLMLALAATATQATEAPWTLAQNDGRIQIFTRPVEGSPFLAVKATAQINAPIADVAAAMGDGNGCVVWRPICKSSEVLGTPSDTERYVRLVVDMPWPVKDRDMVVHSVSHIDADAQTLTVQLQPASDHFPEQDEIRAISTGEYQIKAITDHQVEFTYIMHTDLGGDLPAELVNPQLTASTYDDIARLQALTER